MRVLLRTALTGAAVLALTATAAPAFAAPSVPAAPTAVNLVKNGGFDSGTTSWWNGANTSMSVSGGALSVAVTGGGARWDAPIGQDGVAITAGRSYTISFDVKASKAAKIRSVVQLGANPWTPTHDADNIDVTTSFARKSFTFTSTLTTNAQVGFQLGGNGAFTLGLDNVSLTENTAAPQFYVDPRNNAQRWIDAHAGDELIPLIRDNIATRAGAKWFGSWSGYTEAEIATAVGNYVTDAQNAGKTPILAAYNIYGRDCGGYSAGGPLTAADYEKWIRGFATGIGNRPAMVILEPDAVAQMIDCGMSEADKTTRRNLLTFATQQLAAKAPQAWTYLDAGNDGWIAPAAMAQGLKESGIANVRGFAVNVSNYKSTARSEDYGTRVNAALPTPKKFVVDTSRNGGSTVDGDWCNARGAKLGTPSGPGTGAAEFLLWVKFPGDSDGECTHTGHSDPKAGEFSTALAKALITGNWAGV
ncbi:hypothetical protein Afil01_69060 [Actinorhabdospora filicis]|uniref:Glucanase n=1 Tax=Actinorhabdospora filicis TaxID=1785913 RepID=A0A9W6WCY7_9ACTN|nr:glycoside hydrolase family 6 protein [Actinorhabdospora filicis]GLZ82099.1 hypothetical protein Afil01_69060 [Actinorhabdospora filicis]